MKIVEIMMIHSKIPLCFIKLDGAVILCPTKNDMKQRMLIECGEFVSSLVVVVDSGSILEYTDGFMDTALYMVHGQAYVT